MKMRFASRVLDLSYPQVMGILNITPDSFYDGGQLLSDSGVDLARVLARAQMMVADGASILDVGGESTRPGAAPVSEQEECDRVLPVLERLSAELDVVVSVDTSSPAVITAAEKMGAGLINDVRALTRPGALAAAAATDLPICLMHMQGTPENMQHNPSYQQVVDDVLGYLCGRVEVCRGLGISGNRILLDPGIGFGKTDAHNLALLSSLEKMVAVAPVLLGVSRKSLIGRLLHREPQDRLAASLAMAYDACLRGVSILRVHDVAETADVVAMYRLLQQEKG